MRWSSFCISNSYGNTKQRSSLLQLLGDGKTNANAATLSRILSFVYHPISATKQGKNVVFRSQERLLHPSQEPCSRLAGCLLMTVCLLVKVRKIWHQQECKRGEGKVRGCSLTPVNTDLGSGLPLGCLQQANYRCSVTEKDKNTG